ncbi:MAG: hypothetical protein IT178_16550 [Acidobacteria bacterium]|nr:hypothetical protein [Acidobacteriota bacterium]
MPESQDNSVTPSLKESFLRYEALLEERLRRQASQIALIPFTEYTYPRYETGRPHRIIAEQLERVERGEVDRLMLLVAPRHGKSELASRRFPAWCLGRRPEWQIISASATAELATDFGRDVRNIIASQEYERVFDTKLAEDSQAKGKWNTEAGGGYYAIGVGGAVMGRGADLFVIDDPFATMADAQSETIRDNVWEWYRGTAYNRLQPGGRIVVINHRMHEDDLSGRLLASQASGGDRWEVVELPAFTNGEALWPERFPPEALERIKANTVGRYWSALYMQNPTPDEGTFFKADWFKWYTTPPKVNKFMSSDFAVTEDGGDFTEIGTHGVSADDDLYLGVDYWYGQTSADVWIDKICDQITTQRPYAFFGEAGPIRRSVEPFLTKRMRERKAFCRVEWIPSIHDKATQARSLQARAAMGKVYLPDNEHGHRILAQLLAFPAGKYDDAVDCCAQMARVIDQAHPATKVVAEPPKWRDRYDRDEEANSWKVA